MAKTNPIDSISINNIKYDFDPTELSSLTVTGNLTVNGTTATFNNITADTANLSVIKFNSGGYLTIKTDQEGNLRFTNDASARYAFQTDAPDELLIIAPPDKIISQSSSYQYSYTLPKKSGTIALTSDEKIKYFNFNCYDYTDTDNPLEIDISNAIYVELCASPESIDNRSIDLKYYPEVIVTGPVTEITTISLGYYWSIGNPEDNEHQSMPYLYNKLVIEKFPLYHSSTHEDTVLKTKLDYIRRSTEWSLSPSTVSTISVNNILSTTSYFACGPMVMMDEIDFDGPVVEVPSLKLKIKVNDLGGASSSRCFISGFMIINTKQEKYYNDLLAEYE